MFNVKEDVLPVSDFRRHSAGVLKRLKETHAPVLLTQHGHCVAVLTDADSYERERTEYERFFRDSYERGVEDADKGRLVPQAVVMKRLKARLKRIAKAR